MSSDPACLKCHRPITREPGDGLRALCAACRKPATDSGMSARQIAHERGDLKFIGQPCKTCGCTERYTGNWSCVQCQRSRRTVKETTSRQPPSDRERERQAMRARLALVRAQQSAKQRRAMGLPG